MVLTNLVSPKSAFHKARLSAHQIVHPVASKVCVGALAQHVFFQDNPGQLNVGVGLFKLAWKPLHDDHIPIIDSSAIVSLVFFPAAWKSHNYVAVAPASLQQGMQPAV